MLCSSPAFLCLGLFEGHCGKRSAAFRPSTGLTKRRAGSLLAPPGYFPGGFSFLQGQPSRFTCSGGRTEVQFVRDSVRSWGKELCPEATPSGVLPLCFLKSPGKRGLSGLLPMAIT